MDEVEQAIFQILVDVNEALNIDESFYKMFDNTIAELNKHLFMVWWKLIWRSNEARQNKKAISSTELNIVVMKKLDELRKKEPDPFYFPSLIAFGKDMKELYFCDETAFQCAPGIILLSGLNVPFPPELTLKNILDIRNYVLTIKKLFSVMAQNIDTPLLKIRTSLMLVVQVIHSVTVNTHKKMMQGELERERNRENASTWTPATIKECKNHDLYLQLEQMIRSCKNTPREIRDINKMLAGILKEIEKRKNKGRDTEISRMTIRRYRNLLFEEIRNG